MHPRIEKIVTPYKANGQLAIAANLLFDLVLVGWIAFAGLYALEVLLPTFVIVRLSLVKLAVILLVLTGLLAWLGSVLEIKRTGSEEKKDHSRFLFVAIIIGSVGIVALAHYRFPWWSIPVMLAGYALALWLFVRENQTGR